MTARAKASKCVASVVDGRFRDLEEQRAQGFPVRPHVRNALDISPDCVRSPRLDLACQPADQNRCLLEMSVQLRRMSLSRLAA